MKLIDLNVSIKIDNNDKVIRFLEENECDIITFQEVMRVIDDSVYDKYNNSRVIKHRFKQYQHSFFGALWVAERHIKKGVITKDFGGFTEQGNEVISKFPIVEAENKFYHKSYMNFTDVTDFRNSDHARSVLQAIIQIGNEKLQILNIHGIWNKDKKGDKRTIAQSEFILKKALERDFPTIIVGDFNLNPESESIKMMDEKFLNLINLYGIKSTRPIVKDGLDVGNSVDDYVFVNHKIKVNNFQVINTDISDHYPLILDFEILNDNT